MVDWLSERRARAATRSPSTASSTCSALAAPAAPGCWLARGKRPAEFVGLDDDETRRAVDAGWRVLKLAGIEPDGFVAPAYAYTPALRRRCRALPLVGGPAARAPRAPAMTAAARRHARARLEPRRRRAACAARSRRRCPCGEPALRRHAALGPAPRDLQHPRHMLALEWALSRSARRREAITFEERFRLVARATLARASRAPEHPNVALARSRSALARGGEHRRFEWLDRRELRVAEVLQAEQVLDRAQQREVVERFLAGRVHPSRMARAAARRRRRPRAVRRCRFEGIVGEQRLAAARARVGEFACRGRLVDGDHEQAAFLVGLRARGSRARPAASNVSAGARPAGAPAVHGVGLPSWQRSGTM